MQVDRIDEELLPQVWKLFKEKQDPEARDRLICHYLPLVKYVVGKLAITLPSHVKIDDMYSTGIMGLMKAVERYDTEKKNKFETYAILLIRGAIIDEMRSLDWVPRSVHQRANQIADAKLELQQKLGREPLDTEVAKKLGVSIEQYEKLLERVRPAVMIPLETDQSEDPDRLSMAERIPDKNATTSFEDVDRKEFRKLLEKAVLELPEQERTVLVLYYYEHMMLKEIGKAMGVSESRVSQIHTKAIIRLKGRLKNFAVEFANLF